MEKSENSLNQAVSIFLGKHIQDAPDLTKQLEICYPYDILCYLAHIKIIRKSILSGCNNSAKNSIPFSFLSDTSQQNIQRQRLYDEPKVKQKLTSYLPSDFQLGAAIGEGDCFFDAFAQGLNKLIGKEEYTVKSLRLLCYEFVQDPLKVEWVKVAVKGDNANFEQYTMRVLYTAEELQAEENNSYSVLKLEDIVWGRPDIEGRMICEVLNAQHGLNVNLHVIEVHESATEGVDVTEQIVDGNGSKSIEHLHIENYAISPMVHIVNYHNHFVPLLGNKIAQNKKTLPNFIEPTADSPVFQPNSNSLLKYIADTADLSTFKNQIIILCELANILQKPALFLVKKPLATSDEYLVGIYLNKELLVINPNGNLNLEKNFGQILNEIKNHLQISKFYISETKLMDKSIINLQLSSAICIELIHTFETLLDANLLTFLSVLKNSKKGKKSYKFTFTILNITGLLPDYLNQLANLKEEKDYQEILSNLRKKHLKFLSEIFENINLSLKEQNEILQTCLNTPVNSLIMKLQNKSCNFDNLQEQPEYKILSPKADSKAESVASNNSVKSHENKHLKTAMNREVLTKKKSYFFVQENKHTLFNIQNAQAESEDDFDKTYKDLHDNDDIYNLMNFLKTTALEATDGFIRYKAYFKLSQHYSKLGQFDLALEHIDREISQIEKSINKNVETILWLANLSSCYNQKGIVLKNLGNYYLAEQSFRRAINLFPLKEAYNSLGLLKEKQDKLDEAIEQYKKAIEIDPEYGSPYLNWGLLIRSKALNYSNLEKKKNNLIVSVILFDKALKYGASQSDCLSARADTKLLLDDMTGAEADYKEALRLQPHSASCHQSLGNFYLINEKYNSAKNYLKNAANLDPNNMDINYNLGCIEIYKKNFTKAEMTFNKLKSHPKYSTLSIMNLISIKLSQNNFLAALDLLDDLIKNNNDDILRFFSSHIYGQIGHLFTLFKCYTEAEKAYKAGIKYCEIDAIKAKFWCYIGNTSFDDSNYQSAMDAYQNAAQLDPSKKSIFDEFIVEARQLLQSITQTGQKIITPKRSLSHVKFVPVLNLIDMIALERKNLPLPDINIKNGAIYFKSVISDELSSSGKYDKLEYNTENNLWYRVDPDSSTRKLASSENICDFVVLDQGFESSPRYEILFGNIGHFNLSSSREVLFAGGICLKKGKVLHWNNCTGHYKTQTFAVNDVVEKTKLPIDRYFPREQLKIRLERVINSVNNNMQEAAQELADLTGGDSPDASTTEKLRKYIR